MEKPIIYPNPSIPAMSRNAFNCGVLYDEKEKKFRMLIRGASTPNQAFSDLLYAESSDGYEFKIDPNPVLVHGKNEWAGYTTRGIEDPRIIKWIGYNYIFATACSRRGGREGIWRTKDFYSYEWIGIPYDEEDKDAAILDEAIDGNVYLIDRFAPHIWISYTEDFSLRSGWQNHRILMRKEWAYNSPLSNVRPEKIGVAGPPLKTKFGWLTFIHVVHEEMNKWKRAYSLGFVVLDLKDPNKILHIHKKPILWPEKTWEIHGVVPYVIFSCANVEVGDEIWVYYGGADTVVGLGKIKKDLIFSMLEEELESAEARVK